MQKNIEVEKSKLLKGWILYKDSMHESYEATKLLAAFSEARIEVELVDPTCIDIFVNKEDRKSVRKEGKVIQLPDFVIPRTGSGTTYFSLATMRHLERLGVTLINSSAAINAVKDKLYTLQILGESNLDIPNTMLVKHPVNLKFVEDNIGFPVVIKALSGSYGSGVFLADNKKTFRDLLQMVSLTNKHFNIILQEFIKESHGRDLRVFVVNNKVVGCIKRQSTNGDFRANVATGAEASPFEVDEKIEWLACESAKLLNLDIAGVDLLFDKEGYQICEVNSAPGFKGLEGSTGLDIATEIVNFVKLKLGL